MITSRRRIVQPTEPVVTLGEMQTHLNLDLTGSPPTHPDDDDIEAYVAAATNDLEGEDGWIGRALMPQQWRVTFRRFPSACDKNPDAALFLPYPPLISVDSVTYRATSGASVTLTEGTDYEVFADGDPHAWIAPPYQDIWPVTADVLNAVTVTFTCGYDASASPANPLPAAIKQYVKVLAALMYEQRELDVININIQPVANYHAAAQRFRVYGP